MNQPIRRIVTGHDAEGRSTILFDGPAPNVRKRKAAGWTSTTLWSTDTAPAAYADADRSLDVAAVPPPPRGTIFRIVEFPPESAADDAGGDRNAAVLAELGLAADAGAAGGHRSMHRTESVDYLIVLSGEIDMIMETGTAHLVAGDVVVQQGTLHGFVNRGSVPCRLAGVLVDAAGP